LDSRSKIYNLKYDEWQFVIAGWGQGGHEIQLKKLCHEIGLDYADIPASQFINIPPSACSSPSVVFTGPVSGHSKDWLLGHASAFILSSFSEGLPMAVLEAWSYRLPVLMTEYCNLPDGFTQNAAIQISTDINSIEIGIRHLLELDPRALRLLGSNGRSLVARQFTWPHVAAQIKGVYEWVLGGGARPEYVSQG
jgi:poly(glycerol-phosphate) alpha-glucosyltransferase